MRLVIIDPGFSNSNGHHHTVNLLLNSVFSSHTADLVIFAAKDIDTNTLKQAISNHVHIFPYFTTPCYPPNANSLPRRQHEVLSKLFSIELISLFESSFFVNDDCVLIHTAFSFHISGLARALWFLKGKYHGKVLISMMFHPAARLVSKGTGGEELECFDSREYLRHKFALSTLHSAAARIGVNVMLTVPCRSYQKVYQTLWPFDKVEVHPAVGYRPLPSPTIKSARLRVLLYLGGPKADKGIEFAARLGAAVAEKHPAAEFVFHFNDEFPGASNYAYVIEELKQAGEANKNVEVLFGNLGDDHYDRLLQSCQIICLLYDPAEYSFKTSGIFWDALRCPNIGWLVSRDTWVASELDQLGLHHEKTSYGDISQAAAKIADLLQNYKNGRFENKLIKCSDSDYLSLLNSSFGEWVYQKFSDNATHYNWGEVTILNPHYQPNRAKILVVRTHYDHFSPLSGPGGFLPHLCSLGYTVNELLVPLGADRCNKVLARIQDKFNKITHGYLKSYQGNSVAIETHIQRVMRSYDIVHFVDGEHCGLLSALYKQKVKFNRNTKLIATFHQPESILRQIVADPVFLDGFDHIHLMSPCQVKYFQSYVSQDKLSVVPHGIASELLYEKLPATIFGHDADAAISGFDDVVQKKQILLTVGSWLRDFDGLLATAEEMLAYPDIIFVVVAKGFTLEKKHPDNVHLLNQGISDSQLHALYLRSTLLFLPLQDGAANNAILEAMAHGLPIVTTDLPSTRFYTKNLAMLVPPSPAKYATAICQKLDELGNKEKRQRDSAALRDRAKALSWQKIAQAMHEKLYAPLLQKKP